MKVLVTGASGFIGKAIADALSQAGHAVVRGGRSGPEKRGDQTWISYGDLRENVDWQSLLRGCDVVVHCAGMARVANTREAAKEALAVNAEATAALAAGAGKAGVRHIVFLSSALVYGPQKIGASAADESTAPAPLGTYASSKLAAEQKLIAACEASQLVWTILRPSMVYGSGDGSNFSRLGHLVRLRIPLPLAAATAPKSFLSIRNLTDVVRLSLERPDARRKIFIVCDPEPTSTAMLARHIALAMGRRPRLFYVPPGVARAIGRLAGREDDVARLFDPMELDCSELRRSLGWVPAMRPQEGVAEALQQKQSGIGGERRTIVFLANVDWFFWSHFVFLARRARDDGARVIVATCPESKKDSLVGEGFEVVDLPAGRGGLMPPKLASTVLIARRLLAANPDAVLHGFGLFGIVVGSLGYPSRRRRAVFTITGRGFSAIGNSWHSKSIRFLTRTFIRWSADRGRVRWLAENDADLYELGLARAVGEGRTSIVGGAGVEPDAYLVTPMPATGPLRCALVARAVWSKGLDLAVEAVRRARDLGAEIELSLVGAPDKGNPRSYTQAELEGFAHVAGVSWLGYVGAINDVWRSHHVAILPSRGGEGVPKSLLEAAACGRPMITTDVPGCRELAAKTSGWIVPANDFEALARMLVQVSRVPRTELEMRGTQARQAIIREYTHDQHWTIASCCYKDVEGKS